MPVAVRPRDSRCYETVSIKATAPKTRVDTDLMHRVDYPVDPRVATDSLMLRVHEDDFKVLIR